MAGPSDLELTLSFFGLGAGDTERLVELRPLLEKHAGSLVSAFYRHLLSYEPTQRLLTDPKVRDRLFVVQRNYLLSLASPELGEAYFEGRAKIGRRHVEVGLEPRWYLGAYALYLALLTPLIQEAFRAEPQKGLEIQISLHKRLMLDAHLAIETYISTRQEQLDFLNRELAATGRGLAREVDEQREKLRETRKRAHAAEQLATVGTLAAGLAHEIGTPMGVIRGHAELLDGAVQDERSRWRLQTIVEQIDRVSRIMEALLNLARPHAPVRDPVSLQEVLDTALSFVGEDLRRRSIAVERQYSSVGPIVGDAQKLQQLFLNLILNAADAMPEGGALRVELTQSDGGPVELLLSDSGAGISESDLDKIFEPFFTSKAAGQGSGLGLVVAKTIVAEHGGHIAVSSEEGEGTEFHISLPAASPQSVKAPRS